MGVLLAAAAVLLIAARVYCAAVYRVDSDEPQHLHVVWGVANGLVQYRDIFDNHSPLFQLLCAPLFRALGENAGILVQMRFAVIPLYLGCLACVYWMGSVLHSRRCGAMAAIALAFYPRFFCPSIEFRPDNLWALTWLSLLTVLVCVRRPTVRWLASGFLLGTAFSISMKTSVMVLDLVGAGALTWLVCRKSLGNATLVGWARAAFLFLAGLVVVPGLLLIRFASAKALPDLFYCLIGHNLIASSQRAHFLGLREIAFLGVLALTAWWSWRVYRSTADRPLSIRRVFILTAGGLYPVVLFVFWPLVTREDFLALVPVVILAAILGLLLALEKIPARFRWVPTVLFASLIAVELGGDLTTVRPWSNRTARQAQFIADTLQLTGPEDYVMDAKGETIFRKRPYYYALEEMTRWRLKENRLADDIPEKMTSLGVCVAAKNNQRYPQRTAHFLKANFIPVANRLLVAGKILSAEASGKAIEFKLPISTEYALVWQTIPGTALLDGRPYTGPLRLEAGSHTLQITQGAGPVALMWAQAAQRGFLPFYQPSEQEKREFKQDLFDNIL